VNNLREGGAIKIRSAQKRLKKGRPGAQRRCKKRISFHRQYYWMRGSDDKEANPCTSVGGQAFRGLGESEKDWESTNLPLGANQWRKCLGKKEKKRLKGPGSILKKKGGGAEAGGKCRLKLTRTGRMQHPEGG